MDLPNGIQNLPSPVCMPSAEHVADGIMLQCKQRMQHLHSYPPIFTEARHHVTCGIARKERFPAFLGKRQFAIFVAGTEVLCNGFAGSINLGAIPPGRVCIFISWTLDFGFVENIVLLSALQLHGTVRPCVSCWKGNVKGFTGLRAQRISPSAQQLSESYIAQGTELIVRYHAETSHGSEIESTLPPVNSAL
jgi:hypothetical protein